MSTKKCTSYEQRALLDRGMKSISMNIHQNEHDDWNIFLVGIACTGALAHEICHCPITRTHATKLSRPPSGHVPCTTYTHLSANSSRTSGRDTTPIVLFCIQDTHPHTRIHVEYKKGHTHVSVTSKARSNMSSSSSSLGGRRSYTSFSKIR